MTKIVAMTLAICSALITAQNAQASNPAHGNSTTGQHQSGNGSALLVGNYDTNCQSALGPGSALADTRNTTINGHNQQVVHLAASGPGGEADAFVKNLGTVKTIINSTISFTVVKGQARYLEVIVNFIPHGGSQQERNFVTPNSKIGGSGDLTLTDNGNGNYSIPVGSNGIAQGAQLTFMQFRQSAAQGNCNTHLSDINHFQINHASVGIATDPSSNCSENCGDLGGGDTK